MSGRKEKRAKKPRSRFIQIVSEWIKHTSKLSWKRDIFNAHESNIHIKWNMNKKERRKKFKATNHQSKKSVFQWNRKQFKTNSWTLLYTMGEQICVGAIQWCFRGFRSFCKDFFHIFDTSPAICFSTGFFCKEVGIILNTRQSHWTFKNRPNATKYKEVATDANIVILGSISL